MRVERTNIKTIEKAVKLPLAGTYSLMGPGWDIANKDAHHN